MEEWREMSYRKYRHKNNMQRLKGEAFDIDFDFNYMHEDVELKNIRRRELFGVRIWCKDKDIRSRFPV